MHIGESETCWSLRNASSIYSFDVFIFFGYWKILTHSTCFYILSSGEWEWEAGAPYSCNGWHAQCDMELSACEEQCPWIYRNQQGLMSFNCYKIIQRDESGQPKCGSILAQGRGVTNPRWICMRESNISWTPN